MNVSICVTVFNEEESIGALLDSLLSQSKKAQEIVIVDGGSKDRTIEIISHYQKRFGGIKFLKEKCNRAEGRNLSVEVAKNEIVAITDGGCVADKDWLENLTAPFVNKEVDIAAGFYKMRGDNDLERAMGIFLGVTPRHFGVDFLPSTRSMAFRKRAWEAVGGFPEGRENSAEDTDFNYKSVKLGLRYARVKTAIVEWGMPKSLKEYFNKIKSYAKWDAKYGIRWHPAQRFASHNIKALLVVLRYLLGFTALILSVWYPLLPYLFICIFAYFVWSFRKVFLEFGKVSISLWGPVLQITADFAVISGFTEGLIK